MQQYYLRARYYNQNSGRFYQLDRFAGSNYNPQSLHKYSYCHNDPINASDPSGNAVYLMKRRLGLPGGKLGWGLGEDFSHVYLLFTNIGDGGISPFLNGVTVIDTFSFHPAVWLTGSTAVDKVPARIWQRHPADTDPGGHGIPFHAYLISTNATYQTQLLTQVNNWIQSQPIGYDLGNDVPDPNHDGNEIGALAHQDPPHPRNDPVYYNFTEQNCWWWATIMLVQSGVSLSVSLQQEIAFTNARVGAAKDVILGKRKATQVNRLTHIEAPVDDFSERAKNMSLEDYLR